MLLARPPYTLLTFKHLQLVEFHLSEQLSQMEYCVASKSGVSYTPLSHR